MNAQFITDPNYKLVHCTKCDKSWDYVARKNRGSCLECKSDLEYKCGKCTKIYQTSKSLRRHLSRNCNNKNPKLRCDHCQYETNRRDNLSDHIGAKHLPRVLNAYRCEKCEKSFPIRSYLRKHSKRCAQINHCDRSSISFSCNDCEYKTKYKLHLADHVQAKHLPLDSNLNKCGRCGKNFSWRSSLLKHSRRCGQVDAKKSLIRYSCDHCAYETYYKSSLPDHIRSKHLPRTFELNKCSKCAKMFARRSNLRKHSKFCGLTRDVKLSLMRLSCHHCEYKTDEKPHLYSHIVRKHLPPDPDKTNVCTKCGKNCSSRSSLARHLKVCGPSDPESLSKLNYFHCDHCEYKTVYKHNLAYHVNSRH